MLIAGKHQLRHLSQQGQYRMVSDAECGGHGRDGNVSHPLDVVQREAEHSAGELLLIWQVASVIAVMMHNSGSSAQYYMVVCCNAATSHVRCSRC